MLQCGSRKLPSLVSLQLNNESGIPQPPKEFAVIPAVVNVTTFHLFKPAVFRSIH